MAITITENLDMCPEAAPTYIHLSRRAVLSYSDYTLKFIVFASSGDLNISGNSISVSIVGTLANGEAYSRAAYDYHVHADRRTMSVVMKVYQFGAVAGEHIMQIRIRIDGKDLHSSKIIIAVEDL